MNKKILKLLIPVISIITIFLYLRYELQRPAEDIEVHTLYFPNNSHDFFKIYYTKEFGITNTNDTPILFELYQNNKLIVPKTFFASINGEVKKEYFSIGNCNDYYFVSFFKKNALSIICNKNLKIIWPEGYSVDWKKALSIAKEKIRSCDSTMNIH
ncbi:hypothetical protein [Emticicia sp. 17c]|uniref:hypothetical protein n=1 Tax=Emticicia sp. 17c TaxID=3127704 RepID=UPI00301D08A4